MKRSETRTAEIGSAESAAHISLIAQVPQQHDLLLSDLEQVVGIDELLG